MSRFHFATFNYKLNGKWWMKSFKVAKLCIDSGELSNLDLFRKSHFHLNYQSMGKNKFIFQWWSKVIFTNIANCCGCSWAVSWMCMSVHTHTHTHTHKSGIGICAFMVRKCIASVRFPNSCHPYKVKNYYSSMFISHY